MGDKVVKTDRDCYIGVCQPRSLDFKCHRQLTIRGREECHRGSDII